MNASGRVGGIKYDHNDHLQAYQNASPTVKDVSGNES